MSAARPCVAYGLLVWMVKAVLNTLGCLSTLIEHTPLTKTLI